MLAVAVVVFTMYAVGWILIGAVFIASIALVIGGAAAICGMFFAGSIPAAFACLGSGLVCAGLGIALFVPALFIVRAYAKATPVMWNKLITRNGGNKNG